MLNYCYENNNNTKNRRIVQSRNFKNNFLDLENMQYNMTNFNV